MYYLACSDARVQQETGTQTQGDMSTVLLPFNARCYAPYKVANQMIHLEKPQPTGNNFSGPIPNAHQQISPGELPQDIVL